MELAISNIHEVTNTSGSVLEEFHVGLIILQDIIMNLTTAVHLGLKTAFLSYIAGNITIALLNKRPDMLTPVQAV